MLADAVNLALSQPKMPPGLRWVSDPYRLRDVVRKAKHFKLGAEASAFVADASLDIADHLDEARELSRSPYPTIWVEMDNVARLRRIEERGVALSRRAKGATSEGDPVTTVGWLIERSVPQPSAYRTTYFTAISEGIVMAPLAWAWDCEGLSLPWQGGARLSTKFPLATPDFMFGVRGADCAACDVIPGWTDSLDRGSVSTGLLLELTGELRHIFGLLVTLGHVPSEERAVISIEGDTLQPPPMAKGKPVFTLEHREVLIRVPKRTTITKLITRTLEGIRHKRHDVRGHWRRYLNDDGSMRRQVWISDHKRGDEKLGIIVRSGYRVVA